jgi:hypothetical protein
LPSDQCCQRAIRLLPTRYSLSSDAYLTDTCIYNQLNAVSSFNSQFHLQLTYNTITIFVFDCISPVLNILLPFDSSSKINLLKTNWEAKFTLLPPNEVTTLTVLVRCIKNVPILDLAWPSSWLYFRNSFPLARCIGQVRLIPPKNLHLHHLQTIVPPWEYSCHRTDNTVGSLFIVTTN